jgi:hypothetical protein
VRREMPAQAIKRRAAERQAAHRAGLKTATGVAMWSGAIGFAVMMLAVIASASGPQ